MGRIKSTLIKRSSRKLIEQSSDSFSKEFEQNKKSLGSILPSKKTRNKIAGYISRIKRNTKTVIEESTQKEDNSIFIGGKPFMNYVTAVVVQFNVKKMVEVHIKSRGKFISKAVDVAEVARRKFLETEDVSVKNVKIGSEEFENKEGKEVNVSTLEITLVRG